MDLAGPLTQFLSLHKTKDRKCLYILGNVNLSVVLHANHFLNSTPKCSHIIQLRVWGLLQHEQMCLILSSSDLLVLHTRASIALKVVL